MESFVEKNPLQVSEEARRFVEEGRARNEQMLVALLQSRKEAKARQEAEMADTSARGDRRPWLDDDSE